MASRSYPSPPLEEFDDGQEWDELEQSPEEFSRNELTRLSGVLTDTLKQDAMSAAWRMRAIEEFRIEWEASQVSGATLSGMRARAMRAELAVAMGVSERTIESLIGYSQAIVTGLPATFETMRRGLVTERHARVIADEVRDLTPTEVAVFEAEVLPFAETLTVAKFARKARAVRERIRSVDLAARHEEALLNSAVTLVPLKDGMAALWIEMTATKAVAAYSRIDKAARTLNEPDDTRSLAHKRADVVADMLLDEGTLLASYTESDGQSVPRVPAAFRGVRPEVHVIVPVLTLAGASEAPASLDGYGPISAEAARELVGAASGFYRILTHPETGVALSFGREKYEVPAELKRYLRARDETCRFPGCNRPAAATELDHSEAWEDGGITAAWNLGCLCKGHHRLKHNTAWKVKQAPDGSGVYNWTSPLGLNHRTEPAIQVGAGVQAQAAWLTHDPPPF
jgi:hypothetical protein